MVTKIPLILIFTLVTSFGLSQIIQINPAFPTVNDIITIQYDASKGNGELVGVSPVYTHTGIVTQNGLPNSWSYVRKLGSGRHKCTYD